MNHVSGKIELNEFSFISSRLMTIRQSVILVLEPVKTPIVIITAVAQRKSKTKTTKHRQRVIDILNKKSLKWLKVTIRLLTHSSKVSVLLNLLHRCHFCFQFSIKFLKETTIKKLIFTPTEFRFFLADDGLLEKL